MTTPLAELEASVLEDGVIDEAEVGKIRELIYADGKIDQEEADCMFRLNDATSGKANDPSWTALFIKAISDHVLEDETSPGVVDEAEAEYLKTRIHGDGQVDANEKALLTHLKAKATGTIPGPLAFLFDAHL